MSKVSEKEKRQEYWHLSKGVTLSTIFVVGLSIASQVIAYGKAQEKLENLERQVKQSAQNRIHKGTVMQMFENKDVKIKAIADNLIKVEKGVSENHQLLIKILESK